MDDIQCTNECDLLRQLPLVFEYLLIQIFGTEVSVISPLNLQVEQETYIWLNKLHELSILKLDNHYCVENSFNKNIVLEAKSKTH